MSFELLAAMSENGVIGDKNKIPWYIPEDLMRFKNMTKNSIIIMGRKTFESLPNGPLKTRVNIVLSRNHYDYESNKHNNELIFVTMDNIFDVLEKYKKEYEKIFIIGGTEIYKLFIDKCSILHITLVCQHINGDSLFPYDMNYLTENYKIFDESTLLFSKNNNIPYKYITFKNV
jgi:dihydrofolate reductase